MLIVIKVHVTHCADSLRSFPFKQEESGFSHTGDVLVFLLDFPPANNTNCILKDTPTLIVS